MTVEWEPILDWGGGGREDVTNSNFSNNNIHQQVIISGVCQLWLLHVCIVEQLAIGLRLFVKVRV